MALFINVIVDVSPFPRFSQVYIALASEGAAQVAAREVARCE